jgi:hypothetical protein
MDFTAATHDFIPSQTWDDVLTADPFSNSNNLFPQNDLLPSGGMVGEQIWQSSALCDPTFLTAVDPPAFVRPSDTDLLRLPQPSQGVVVEPLPQECGDGSLSRWTDLEKDLLQALSADFPGQSQFELLESSEQGFPPPTMKSAEHLSNVDQEMLDRDSSSPLATIMDGATPPGEYDGNRLVSCSTCQKIVKRRKLQ